MTTYPNKQIPICDLQIGDVCRVFDGPWGTAIVKQISEGFVTFYRPYGHADLGCRYSGNQVICYSGLEEFTRSMNDKSTVFVYQRPEEQDFEIALKLSNGRK